MARVDLTPEDRAELMGGSDIPRKFAAGIPPSPAATPTPIPPMAGGMPTDPRTGMSLGDIGTWGPGLERGYEQYVVPPGQRAIGRMVGGTLETLRHPIQSLSQPNPLSPQTPMTGFEKGVGEAIMPPTIPQLGRDIAIGATNLMEAPWWASGLALTGGSAVLGGLTGRSPGEEALRGGEQWLFTKGLQKLGAGTSAYLTDLAETRAAKSAMQKVGALLNKKWDILPPLNTSKDWIDVYGRGDITGPGGEISSQGLHNSVRNLEQVNKRIAQEPGVQNHVFWVKELVPDLPRKQLARKFGLAEDDPKLDDLIKGDIMWSPKNFTDLNETIHQQARIGYDPRTGAPRPGINADDFRHLAYDNRDNAINKLNNHPTIAPGKNLGNDWGGARRAVDASHVMTNVITKTPNLWRRMGDESVLDQRAFVNAIRSKEGLGLLRSMSREEFRALEQAAKHGQPEEIFDVPSEPAGYHGRLHFAPHAPGVIPSVGRTPGVHFDPSGTEGLPWWADLKKPLKAGAQAAGAGLSQYWPGYNQPATPELFENPPGPTSSAGGGLSSLLGEGTAYAEEPPPDLPPKALPAIRDLQHREISPTPGGAERAGQIAKGLVPGKAPVNIQQDLERGRLSSDEVKKLLQRSGSKDPGAQVAGIPLTDLMGAAETGTPAEKQYLVPLIQQRLMQELPKLGNKTTQANLARRFRLLQRDAVPATVGYPNR